LKEEIKTMNSQVNTFTSVDTELKRLKFLHKQLQTETHSLYTQLRDLSNQCSTLENELYHERHIFETELKECENKNNTLNETIEQLHEQLSNMETLNKQLSTQIESHEQHEKQFQQQQIELSHAYTKQQQFVQQSKQEFSQFTERFNHQLYLHLFEMSRRTQLVQEQMQAYIDIHGRAEDAQTTIQQLNYKNQQYIETIHSLTSKVSSLENSNMLLIDMLSSSQSSHLESIRSITEQHQFINTKSNSNLINNQQHELEHDSKSTICSSPTLFSIVPAPIDFPLFQNIQCSDCKFDTMNEPISTLSAIMVASPQTNTNTQLNDTQLDASVVSNSTSSAGSSSSPSVDPLHSPIQSPPIHVRQLTPAKRQVEMEQAKSHRPSLSNVRSLPISPTHSQSQRASIQTNLSGSPRSIVRRATTSTLSTGH
jgi:myosin heavy subunit